MSTATASIQCLVYARSGSCAHGQYCKFKHGARLGCANPSARPGGNRRCLDYDQKDCQRVLCPYLHLDQLSTCAANSTNNAPTTTTSTPCLMYTWTGYCVHGQTCKFQHGPRPGCANPASRPGSKLRCLDYEQGDCQRVICQYAHEE